MRSLPLRAEDRRNPDALRDFLRQRQTEAAERGQAQLVSISMEVEHLDPLAVLESIYEEREAHFYCERPAAGVAVAGAEAVVSATAEGPERFSVLRRYIEQVLDNTVVVGDLSLPLCGPLFFCAFAFFDQAGVADAFPAARVFVPRWQVTRREHRSVATANVLVEAEGDVDALAARVWRAHAKFVSFDYGSRPEPGEPASLDPLQEREVGEEGGFRTAVREGLKDIGAGRYQKIVLARATDLSATAPLHPLRLLNGLRRRFPECTAFSVANGVGQSFIGATPERLLTVEGGLLRTEALAGSAPRGRTAAEDAAEAARLMRSEKDLREHQLVLDSIVRRLGRLGVSAEHPGRPRLLQLSNVQHLQTPVTAALSAGDHLLDLVGELHPTPAVGGSPRQPACQRIRELEPFDRGLYAGALGWVNHAGEGEFFVGIRSALVEGERARLFAGAGIVAGSDPDGEFTETELKLAALHDAFFGRG